MADAPMKLPDLLAGRRRGAFLRLLGNGLAQGVLAVLSAWLVMRLFAQLDLPQGEPLWPLLYLVGVVLCGAWLRRSERIQAELLGQHYVRSVRRRLYTRLLGSNPRDIQGRRKGAILLKFVGDLSALRRWISLGLARLLVAGVAVTIALAALSWMYWPFAVGVGGVLALASAWILYSGRSTRAAIAEARRHHANLAANVTEKLSHVTTVQACGREAYEHRRLRRQSAHLLDASVRKAAKIGSLRATIDAAAGTCVVMVLAIAFVLPPGNLSAGMVAAVISIIGFLTPPLRELGRVQEYWLAAQVARANLVEISGRTRRVRSGRKSFKVTAGRIRFTDVSINDTLHAISVEAPGGSKIALLGPNGSGKSTLLGLAGRLFDPDRGRVSIDGRDLTRARLTAVRQQIAYVSTAVPLLRGSLRKNLCYGAGRVDPEHLAQVLQDCELQSLVDRLPHGLETRIAEGGANLSQGERMRVTLARGLLRKPRVLLIDEADANLDALATRALETELAKFKGTVIMATHRRSALHLCDSIWLLRDGRLEARDNTQLEDLPSPADVVALDQPRTNPMRQAS